MTDLRQMPMYLEFLDRIEAANTMEELDNIREEVSLCFPGDNPRRSDLGEDLVMRRIALSPKAGT